MYNSLKASIYSGFIAIFLSIIYFIFQPYIDRIEIITYLIVEINILAMIFCLNFAKLFLEIIADN